MTIYQYIEQVKKLYKSGLSSEHSYRGDLRTLLESIVSGVMVTNEPKRIECGAPDYILTRNEIPVGFIEAKDLGKDISSKEYKKQFDRYRKSLNNLIITDYIDFWLYIDGEFKTKIRIAEIADNQVKPIPENFEQFTSLIKSFCTYTGQTIKSAAKLSIMMADKAKLLAEIIESALTSDQENEEDSTLREQMQAFKDILIHDIKPKEFSDIYAQTIAYGMFAARLHDTTLNTFTRQEAAELIPKTNPFLRKLFQYVAGYDLDSRIVWIVDALADIFRATDVAALLQNFGKSTQMNDPIIHFYETFLAQYDPALRKSRGVWYTPEPVVNFIVRAVDDILKSEFNLPDGLADYSKIKIKKAAITKATSDQRSKVKEVETEVEVHKVQILDPATGTGTFLAEVVKQVYSKFKGQQGIWNNYVENHLVPRLNGFELLMASYAMAHLKLDMLLAETGYKATKNQRFRIYLTNSLEEHHQDTGTLFANWLSSEANEANYIKRDTPVMVVIGNPPYSVSSSNKSKWIEKLTSDYKKDLNERNIQPLSDDYIKFIRFGQHFIEKNGEGILAYISNNSFVDGLIHRKMRKHLLETFEKIYILNLHGNALKKEIAGDGSNDQNVFDIKQGVSINLFFKTIKKEKNTLGNVYHYDLLGSRIKKYEFLLHKSLEHVPFEELNPNKPNFFFSKKDLTSIKKYNEGIYINSLFNLNSNAVKTHRDGLVIDISKSNLIKRMEIFYDRKNTDEKIRTLFDLKDNRDWKLNEARNLNSYSKSKVLQFDYRPFDTRTIYFEKQLIDFGRENIMKHIIGNDNIAFLCNRQIKTKHIAHYFLTKNISDFHILETANASVNVYPLYLYPDTNGEINLNYEQQRIPNINKDVIQKLVSVLNLTFSNEKESTQDSFAPIDILDFIYANLYNSNFLTKYEEFLKIDFPRIPYPKDKAMFWNLVKLGGDLRKIHLFESSELNNFITTYPQNGNNMVVNIKYYGSKVYINESQYFEGVPEIAWNFYIGGYQPAQKWLKDRKGRELSFDDILHYQRIIVALTETDKLMKEIDKIEFE